MKATWFKIVSIALIISISVSCSVSYGNRIARNFTKLNSDTCSQKANKIKLYFDNEKIDFEYEKIGFVEAIGSQYSSNEEIIDHLKYTAWSNCANAIINIKTDFKERESGTLLSDKESIDKYSGKVFNGIAVRILNDTNKTTADTSFVNKVKNYDQSSSETASNETAISIIGGIAVIFVIILLSANKK